MVGSRVCLKVIFSVLLGLRSTRNGALRLGDPREAGEKAAGGVLRSPSCIGGPQPRAKIYCAESVLGRARRRCAGADRRRGQGGAIYI